MRRSSRERATEGVPSLAPHENRVAEGEPLKELEVFRQLPGHGAVETDGSVCGHSNYSGKGETHTEMGALMWGCGS